MLAYKLVEHNNFQGCLEEIDRYLTDLLCSTYMDHIKKAPKLNEDIKNLLDTRNQSIFKLKSLKSEYDNLFSKVFLPQKKLKSEVGGLIPYLTMMENRESLNPQQEMELLEFLSHFEDKIDYFSEAVDLSRENLYSLEKIFKSLIEKN